MTATLRATGSAGETRATSHQLLIGVAAIGLCVAAFLALSIGPTGITLTSLPRVLSALASGHYEGDAAREQLVLIEIRLPRLLLGIFVGASLAVAGAMMQGMFRNPLADPGLIGVSSGAALAAVATIALGNGIAAPWIKAFGAYALPFAAFIGGMATTIILISGVGRHGQIGIATLLLAGIALASLNGGLMGLIQYSSDDRELRDLTLWMLGSLSGASWPKVLGVLPFALLLVAVLPQLIRGLNGLLLGEAEAFHLGIDVHKTKRMIAFVTAAGVGAAVAVSGIVGFVGIVVPHVVRLIAVPDHRVVLPASALMGATLVLVADTFARMLVRPAELPLGVVMAIIGAPIFLHMVVRRGMAAS